MNTECLLVLAPITVPYEYGLSLTMTSFFFQVTALIGNICDEISSSNL